MSPSLWEVAAVSDEHADHFFAQVVGAGPGVVVDDVFLGDEGGEVVEEGGFVVFDHQVVGVGVRHQVKYVIIGGAAARFYLAGLLTHDVDFTPAIDADNLARLSGALTELGALIRTDAVPEGLPFAHDAASLGRSKMWNLQCVLGAFDIAFEPAGGGYHHLAARARLVTVRGVDIPVGDLADIVASKRLANDPRTSSSSPSSTTP
jgi:hypothetical protein